MSFSTQIFYLATVYLLATASASFATELDEIETAREKAQMDYVHEASISKDKSPEYMKALYDRIMEPSAKRLHDYADKAANVYNPRKSQPDLSKVKVEKSEMSSLAPKSRSPASTASQKIQERDPNRGKRPEYVLDGKDIPKEIDFSAPEKPK